MKKIWIITSEINEYDQGGEYFEMAFLEKPTAKEIMKSFGCELEFAQHLLNGGGRLAIEYKWYHLFEIEPGNLYESSQ